MTHRILLVEDDPVSRDLIASLLGVRGHIVETAADGFSALRMAQEEPYDLVFVDYHLPEMDGYALARLMRTLGETTNASMKMVAITADRFGLAARRGVDSIFDRVLPKPIDPDVLFAFVDEFLSASQAEADDLDAFFAEPTINDAQSAAHGLWRVRGMQDLPTAAVFPAPSPDERVRLEYCFKLVEAEVADCLLLLHRAGLAGVEAHRASARAYLQPLFALEDADADVCDLLFKVGDGDSWSAAALCLAQFRDRRRQLKPQTFEAKAFEARLAAYLYVADRSLLLRRDQVGRARLANASGFAAAATIEAIKLLAGQGLVAAKPRERAEGAMRELCVSLTAKGLDYLARPSAVTVLAAG